MIGHAALTLCQARKLFPCICRTILCRLPKRGARRKAAFCVPLDLNSERSSQGPLDSEIEEHFPDRNRSWDEPVGVLALLVKQ